MTRIVNLSRRAFLKVGAVAGGGLVLGFYLPGSARKVRAADPDSNSFMPNAFVRVGKDESITIIVNHSEMGQGPYTSMPMVIAEEMDANWSKVRYEAAPVDPAYNHSVYGMQMTGGSTSTWSEWERARKAGAAARAMLVAAAATAWNVDPATCRTEDGFVLSSDGRQRLSFGQLVDKAAGLKPPAAVKLKDPKDFKIVGRRVKRLDTPIKTNGKAVFGLDVNLPDMLVAVVARPPVFGGKVKSFDATRCKAVPGVRGVVEIERGVAVAADGYWPAKLGREVLDVIWDEGPLSDLDTELQGLQYVELARTPGVSARKDGDAAAALASAAKTLEATFDLPYLAHATMEPINCVAHVRDDGCDVWTGTQFQTVDHDGAVRDSGLKPEQVRIHTTLLGGGFGRRAVPDAHFVCEAVQLSKKLKRPVKVVWSREDDTRGGYYRPRAHHVVKAGLDADGKPVAWQQRIVCQSIMVGTPFEKALMKGGLDETAVEGAMDLPYAIANVEVDWKAAPTGIPMLWWRSVGHSHTAFAVESFIDELAHAAGKDPFEYRRALLASQPRHRRVLELAADKAGWGAPRPAGRFCGIAVHESFKTYVAYVAEVSVTPAGAVRVHRVVGAVDCGPVVNPDTIAAQIEGGVTFALSAMLYGEITFQKGRVQQRNFHDYRVLRMHEAPQVEVHIVPSNETMGGVGEPGVPPVAPAVANAIFAATGKRIRHLPIRPEDLKSGQGARTPGVAS